MSDLEYAHLKAMVAALEKSKRELQETLALRDAEIEDLQNEIAHNLRNAPGCHLVRALAAGPNHDGNYVVPAFCLVARKLTDNREVMEAIGE